MVLSAAARRDLPALYLYIHLTHSLDRGFKLAQSLFAHTQEVQRSAECPPNGHHYHHLRRRVTAEDKANKSSPRAACSVNV